MAPPRHRRQGEQPWPLGTARAVTTRSRARRLLALSVAKRGTTGFCGLSGADILYENEGNDILIGGGGKETGGAGPDLFQYLKLSDSRGRQHSEQPVKLYASLARSFQDARHFGPGVLLRHGPWHKNGRKIRLHADGIRSVVVRGGESDVFALRQTFIERQYDFQKPKWLRERIAARYRGIIDGGGKPIIVDAGANIGAASLWFRWKFPAAYIVAVEPEPENAAILPENLANRPRTVTMEAAIGAERGHVTVQKGAHSWAARTERSPSGVPMVTIEDAFEASGGDTPFIVKIDIEGFEEDLFAKNFEWIDKCYAIFIEPHDWRFANRHPSRTFQQAMARYPFKVCIFGENLLYVRA